MDGVTFKEIKTNGVPHWVAMKDGKVIATSMSENGVRSIIMTMENKSKKKDPK